ncbi:MAG: outer membrane beta-barrel protein [Emcibacteraceae bacterium]|nr:outer membrane beta-barrel protein [Emcibacteraceae bacterium]
MKNLIVFTLILIATSLPFTASAQGSNSATKSNVYAVLEAGSTQNSMALSGTLATLNSQNNSGGSFGVALGYRSIFPSNLLVGVEVSVASSSGSSSVSDNFDTITFESNYVYGTYLTLGMAMDRVIMYGLVGIGGTNVDASASGVFTGNTTISDSGSGISFGGAVEFGIADNFGIRAKILHTRYKGDLDELKIRDTSIMGGLIYNF